MRVKSFHSLPLGLNFLPPNWVPWNVLLFWNSIAKLFRFKGTCWGKRRRKKEKENLQRELKTAEKRWSHYELPECYPWVEQRVSAPAREPGEDFTWSNCKGRRQHSAAWQPTHPGRLCPNTESLWGKHSSYLLESLSCLWKRQGWNKDFSLKRLKKKKNLIVKRASQVGSVVKNLPAVQET